MSTEKCPKCGARAVWVLDINQHAVELYCESDCGWRETAMEHIDALLADRDRLAEWKDEMLMVDAMWDVQAVGKAIGVKWSDHIQPKILPYIQQANADRDRLQAELDRWRKVAGEMAMLTVQALEEDADGQSIGETLAAILGLHAAAVADQPMPPDPAKAQLLEALRSVMVWIDCRYKVGDHAPGLMAATEKARAAIAEAETKR